MARLDKDLLNYESISEKDGVLINKLGIDDSKLLEKTERIITNAKLAALYMKPITGNFDVDHYLGIHKYLFEDIYPKFAGEIRSESINKRIPFCLPHLIYNNLNEVLRKARILVKSINSREDLVEAVTWLYSELDIIHPFREGNGRCEREFIRQYVLYVSDVRGLGNYIIDYSKIEDNDKFIDAVVKADMCRTEDLYNIINNIVVLKNKENEIENNNRKR